MGIIPSKTALSTHHLIRWAAEYGPLTEAEESYALHVAQLTGQLDESVIAVPNVRMPGSPTAFVSLRSHPNADRRFVETRLAGLSTLGSPQQRQRLLEAGIPSALRSLLPEGFSVVPVPSRFHDRSSDVAVTGPDHRMFNIELRNRRTHVHDALAHADRKALEASHASRRNMLFVTPRSTIRFRREIAALGGAAIDTHLYVVANEQLARLVFRSGWSCWPATTPASAIPVIAGQVAAKVMAGYAEPAPPRPDGVVTNLSRAITSAAARREVQRLLTEHRGPGPSGSRARVDMALQLHAEGVETLGEAAQTIGCAPSTLSKDFKSVGAQSPWSWGGRRPGAGRKSS